MGRAQGTRDDVEGWRARMELRAGPVAAQLVEDEVARWSDGGVSELAASLRAAHPEQEAFAKAGNERVRDGVEHSWDAQDPRVTESSVEALRESVGLCFAKAHLLTALLRAQGVPAGLCYQRLTDDDGQSFLLHGLVAVHLRGGWHRQDPRGNKEGVDAQFSLEQERLAWPVRPELGEADLPQVHVHPDEGVVAVLRQATDALALCAGGLPSDLASGSSSS